MNEIVRPLKPKGRKRFLAGLFDSLILLVPGLFLFIIDSQMNYALGISVLGNFISFLIGLIYYSIFFYTKRATPGMIIMGIHVGKKYGEQVSFLRILLRHVTYTISNYLTLGIASFWVFSSKRETLYDKLSGTFIYERSPSQQQTKDQSVISQ